MRSQVNQVLFSGTRSECDFPENLNGLSAWAVRYLSQIPQECRSSAQIELSTNDEVIEVTITFTRDETDEEVVEREAWTKQRVAREERNERAMYDRLRAKFAPPTRARSSVG